MKPELQILECAKKNMQREEVAEKMNCTSRHVGRICREKFNHTYKELQFLVILAGIYEMKSQNASNREIANTYFHGNTQQLSAYVSKFSGISLGKIQIKGGRLMTQEKERMLEAKVITILANSAGKNITLKQLGVPRCIIVGLRQKNFDIISVPGRYNGGYNLGQTSKETCLSWINNIRVKRYGLPGNYSF